MHHYPPPEARDLLPPLLACLPAAFVSPRPLPALLPLLSPLLRQRVNFLSADAGTNGWLPLLSWDPEVGSRLPPVVENMDLEPHPVSGELEIDEVRPAKYRRLDAETLQAKLDVDQFKIIPIYVWCDKDDHGGTEPGWKLADLRTSEDTEDEAEWFESQAEADSALNISASGGANAAQEAVAQDDGDDDYWNAYDKTEERTPAQPSTTAGARTTDADYYARYGEEVQPAMDSHDPDEAGGELGGSTLQGNSLLQPGSTRATSSNEIADQADYLRSLQPHTSWKPQDSAFQTAMEQSINGEQELSMPRPISPVGSQSSVDKLEETAARMSNRSNSSDRAQLSIQQHIGTEIKSLFRLAKANGMSRADFSDKVQRELEVLSILDDE